MLDPSVCLSENVEFTEGGRDLNMFTAIVLELGRETHIKKLRDIRARLVFCKTKRSGLWKGYVESD
jgi:hypothetical protein